LEAFTALLKHLPLDSGMGFVLVQHLDPLHESALTAASKADLPRCRFGRSRTTCGVEAQSDLCHSAQHEPRYRPGRFEVAAAPEESWRAPSIDSFLESLAQDQRECAIGVILSGTATDGTLGLEAIKAEGGITFRAG
jgi:two-component system CheB/CheR fusion protein